MASALLSSVGWLLVSRGSAHGLRRGAHGAAPQQAVLGGDVEAWLVEAVFNVPDSTFQEIHLSNPWPVPDVYLNISGVVCGGLRIGAERREPGSGGLRSELCEQGPTLSVNLSKINASCTAVVNYSIPGLFGVEGMAKGTITANEAFVSVNATIKSSDLEEPRVPDSVRFDGCSSELNLKMTGAEGSKWTEMVDKIPGVEGKLESVMDEKLDGLVCGLALEYLKKRVNGVLESVSSGIRRKISKAPPTLPPEQGRWVSLATLPLVNWVQRVQKEFLNPQRALDQVFSYLEPTGKVCLFGTEERAMLPPTCLFGSASDAGCAVQHSLADGSEAPASLRVEVADTHLAPQGIRAGLIEPTGATWVSNATVANASVSSVLDITFSGWVGGVELRDSSVQLAWTLEATKFQGALHTVLGLDHQALAEVPDFQTPHPGCLASSINYLDIADMEFTFDVTGTDLSLLRNTKAESPLVAEAVELAQDAMRLLRRYDNALVSLLNAFVREDVRPALTVAAQEWAAFQKESGSCPVPLGEETENWGFHIFRGRLVHQRFADQCLGACLACLALAAVLVPILWWRDGLSGRAPPTEAAGAPAKTPEPERTRAALEPGWCDALCTAGRGRSAATAVVVLSAWVCCFLLYIASNVMLFAATTVNLEQGGYPGAEPRVAVHVMQVQVYSVLYSIRKLWLNGWEQLGWLLFCTSFALPYLKLALLLLCWLLPTRVLPAGCRGWILIFLDQIGKFALVDVFVIQIISTVLYATIHLESPGNDPLTFVLRTNQDYGFTVFVCATVSCLLFGHLILHLHEHNEVPRVSVASAVSESHHDAGDEHPRDSSNESWKQVEHWILGPATFFTLVLAVVGTFLPAFTVRLWTPFMELDPVVHSLWSLGAQLPELSEDPPSIQARFGQAVYLFFIGAVHVHLVGLLCIWLLPQLPSRYRWAQVVMRHTFAWAALDVALISFVLTIVEMNRSQFGYIHGERKASLESFLGRSLPDNLLKADISFGVAVYFLCPVTILHPLVGRWLLAAVAKRQGERSGVAEGPSSSEEAPDGSRRGLLEDQACGRAAEEEAAGMGASTYSAAAQWLEGTATGM